MRTIPFFILLAFTLPGKSQTIDRQKAIELNNKAIKMRWESGDRNKKLRQANSILDSAIKIDPNNLMSYTNKFDNLIALREFKSAIQVTELAIKVKPVLEILTAKGALLAKTGDLTAAKQTYTKALEIGQSTYKLKPSSNLLCNLAVVHYFLNGKQNALDFVKTEKIKFSNDSKGLKQINVFEKMLPTLTVDKILGISPPVSKPPSSSTSLF